MCSARWDEIKVPVYTVGNWGGWGLHLRGNTEAYLCAASKQKKLRIHTGDHFRPFHSNEGKVDQLRFFDYWLKGMQNGIMDEPPIKLEIRTGGSKKPYAFRFENEWPLARTQWTKMYFSIEKERSPDEAHTEGRLVTEQVPTARQISYSGSNPNKAGIGSGSSAAGIGRSGVSFVTDPMARDTEITGPLMANLWVSSTAEDMDVMVTLRNIDPEGNEVFELGQQGQPVVPTKGWLRASHRKLDPQKSLPYRPYHAHNERLWLEPNVPVECQIEIISTCIVLKKGHQLRVDIHAQDSAGSGNFTHFHADYNEEAIHTFYAGGAMNSYILLPIIPT